MCLGDLVTINNREQLLTKAYHLILDPTVSQDERDSLVAFKTDLEQGSDDSRSMMKLAESLRQLSVKGLKNGGGGILSKCGDILSRNCL